VLNAIILAFLKGALFFILMPITGGCFNPAIGLIYSLFQYANTTFKPPVGKTNPWDLSPLNYRVSLDSLIIYTLAPLLGGLLAGLMHWKTVTINRRYKFGNMMEDKDSIFN